MHNPYAPGAGAPPPELAGRAEIRSQADIALRRLTIGRASKGIILYGLRGVGKTVLLNQIRMDAELAGFMTASIELPERRSLPAQLATALDYALRSLSRRTAAREGARRALRVLAGFVGAWQLTYQDISVNLNVEPEPGVADSGDLDFDLPELLGAVGLAAQSSETCLALFIDEMQYCPIDQLRLLLAGLHQATQRQLPLGLIGAGLPQLRGRVGEAKTYAERQFDFYEIGSLSDDEARLALARPAEAEGVQYDADALAEIVTRTRGFPYFLQEWGKHVWNVADLSPITVAEVERASERAEQALDDGFFGVRMDRLTPAEHRYVRAMARLGSGPYRSGEIADALGRKLSSVAPTRQRLIDKGVVWSPNHGQVAFTVPLFDEFITRTTTEFD